jgi:hypothetical protein
MPTFQLKDGFGLDNVTNCATARSGYIPVFAGTAPNLIICNSAIFQSNGKIGINTTSPAYNLDVHGGVNVTGNLAASGSVSVGFLTGGQAQLSGVFSVAPGIAVQGIASGAPSNVGVEGVASGTVAQGVIGHGPVGVGGYGSSPGGLGIQAEGDLTLGSNSTGLAAYGDAYGVLGESYNGNGVGVEGQGLIGVVAGGNGTRDDGGEALYANVVDQFGVGNAVGVGVDATGPQSIAVYGAGDSTPGSMSMGVTGSGELFGLFANGNFGATGTKSAVVALPDDRVVLLYAVESPENWFEDFGTAQLHNGVATVKLDPTFAETVNTAGYHVFLTANGESRGLYVGQKSPSGFKVREQGGGHSNIDFDYRIVAKRKGYENLRLTQVDVDAKTLAAIRKQTSNSPRKLVLKLPQPHEKPKPPQQLSKFPPRAMGFPKPLSP